MDSLTQKLKRCHHTYSKIWISFFCWTQKKQFKISSFVFSRRKKFTQVWNKLRVC